MRQGFIMITVVLLLAGCEDRKEISSINPENWKKRSIDLTAMDSLEFGKSYLSVYSQIYSTTEEKTHNLTSMISMRNMSETDSIYLLRAEYFDTHGKSVRKYFDSPLFLSPLETAEIIIDEIDTSGGTGSNFIFEWKIPKDCPEPFFEAIMTSTLGQQGLSFTTQGKRLE